MTFAIDRGPPWGADAPGSGVQRGCHAPRLVQRVRDRDVSRADTVRGATRDVSERRRRDRPGQRGVPGVAVPTAPRAGVT